MSDAAEALSNYASTAKVRSDGTVDLPDANTRHLVALALAAAADPEFSPGTVWDGRTRTGAALKLKTNRAWYITGLVARSSSDAADVKALLSSAGPGGFRRNSLWVSVREALDQQVAFPGKAVHVGPTGKDPFNNSPWLNQSAFTTSVRAGRRGEPELHKLESLLDAVSASTPQEAREGLVAFLRALVVDIDYGAHSAREGELVGARRRALVDAVDGFLHEDPEGGKRCQALLAAALSSAFGDGVMSGKINDPSFRLPGDVQVMDGGEATLIAEAKHRDDVSESEVRGFVRNLAANNYSRAIYFALGPGNDHLRALEPSLASDHDMVTKVITTAEELLDLCFLWSPPPMAQRFIDRFVSLYRVWLSRLDSAAAKRWESAATVALDAVTP